MSSAPVNVLFVSLRNTVRSTLAHACLDRLGAGRFRAYSCGAPGHVGVAPEPAVEAALRKSGLVLPQAPRRDWHAVTKIGATRMHYVMTLAAEVSDHVPAWPGQPVTAIWPVEDVYTQGAMPEALDKAVWNTLLLLRRRIELLASLPMRSAARSALQHDIRDMADMR